MCAPILTRYAYLTNIANAARQYATRVLTNPDYAGLTTDAALEIAHEAERERDALTFAQATQDIELYWQQQQKLVSEKARVTT